MAVLPFSYDRFPELDCGPFHLRQVRLDDVEAMFALHSDEEVMRYNYDPLVNIEQAEARFHMIEPEFREQRLLRWAITRKEDDRMIGTVIISNWIRPFASADLGYDLAREYWGRGIMTEILKRVLAFGFEEMGLNRIEASSAPENVGSRRVLEKLGFAYEGTLKEKWYMNGRYWDAVVMGLLRRDYLQRLEDGSTSSKKS